MMSSICSKEAIDDVVSYDPTVQKRYVNLQKWAESDAEFVKRVTNGVHKSVLHPTVVDSVSCRQMYLRSYTFSKKKDPAPEKMKKYFTKFKEQIMLYPRKITNIKSEEVIKEKKRLNSALVELSTFGYFKKRLVEEKKMKQGKRRATGRLASVKRVREMSFGDLLSLFRRLLYCTTKVDVAVD